MLGNLFRCLLTLATSLAMLDAAHAQASPQFDIHREAVDASQYPWSAIGKLYNETGGACTAVIIANNKVLTAAHCVFNFRTQRFIPAAALHFLTGYRGGQYTAHVRVVSYEMGAGFDPLRYQETNGADWAVLTLTEKLPATIEPLRLSAGAVPSGTKAIIAGYPQDRAFAMTADGDCEMGQRFDDGRLFLHTCRGIRGYSGAPILVRTADNKVEVAGIHVAAFRGVAAERMLAVPAQTVQQALKMDDLEQAPLYANNNIAGYDERPMVVSDIAGPISAADLFSLSAFSVG